MQVHERLAAAMAHAGLDTATVAKRMNLTEAGVRHHHNGTRTPSIEQIAKYSSLYKVSTDWIITGSGRGPGDKGEPIVSLWSRVPLTDRDKAIAVLEAFATEKKK